MNIFNWSNGKKSPSQLKLGDSSSLVGSYFGFGFDVDDFNLYSQIKDYRTDLLNGTKWSATDPNISGSLEYLQFFKLLQKYSTAIYNDYNKIGYVVFARIDNKIFYISSNHYTKSEYKITVHEFPTAETFEFDEPNAFCGEKTIYKKCESYQKLYNIALSCQKNGMSKSGFVNVVSPKTPKGANTAAKLTDDQISDLEKRLSESHGVATSSQNNMMILKQEVDIKTIMFDFSKLGIIETKKLCEEFVCSKMGVPYVLLPSSGQTFTNFEQANKMLYENHSKYCEYFCNFAKSELGFDITYNTIAEAGKGIE